MTTFEKQLFVNGSLNPSLSLQEIIDNFSLKDYVQAAWNVVVHSRMDSDSEFSHKMIEADPEGMLKTVWDRAAQLKAEKKLAEDVRLYDEGEKLGKMITSGMLPKTPFIPMYPAQAKGFCKALSSFNRFNKANLVSIIDLIEELGIKQDCGINNPNTGEDITYWCFNGDAWVLRFDGVGKNKHEEWLANHESSIMTILKNKSFWADSVRIEKEDFHIDFVIWWD